MEFQEKYPRYKTKYLFVMFQGASTNIKSWNEYTESKFLDKLKQIGEIYLYQDKTYNIWHYDKTNNERNDFSSDIDFDMSYINLDKHLKTIFDDIRDKYKNYLLIPVGWSAGAYLAYYFAQKYYKYCKLCIVLDPCGITSKNINLRLKDLHNEVKNILPITNNKLKLLLENLKINKNKEDVYKILCLTLYARTLFIKNKLCSKFSVCTLSFVNLQEPEKNEYSESFNNETRLREIKMLRKINLINYYGYIFKNKSHYIFNKKQATKKIINIINMFL